MKIEVDTKNDSPEEILHAIKLLKAAVGETSLETENSTETFSNSPEDNQVESEKNIGFMNMFSDNSMQDKETFTNDQSEFDDSTEEETKDDNNEEGDGFFDISSMIEISTEPHQNLEDDDDEPAPDKEEEIVKNEEKEHLIEELDNEKDILQKEIFTNTINQASNKPEIKTYDSFYKDFDDSDDSKEEETKDSIESEPKPKKKLFNLEFY